MSPNHASLPMYDLPELRQVTDRWWCGLAEHLRSAGVDGVPEMLNRRLAIGSGWRSPSLLLSQSCGYPLMTEFQDHLQVLVSPGYAAQGCEGIQYSSAVVVREDDPAVDLEGLRNRVCAVNAKDSQSGYNALRALIAPLARGASFFSQVIVSGSHIHSLQSLSVRRADVCAIDAVTLALLKRYRPQLTATVRIIAWTPSAPSLPYVTHNTRSEQQQQRLIAGLRATVRDPTLAETRSALLLHELRPTTNAMYATVLTMERSAAAVGYAQIS